MTDYETRLTIQERRDFNEGLKKLRKAAEGEKLANLVKLVDDAYWGDAAAALKAVYILRDCERATVDEEHPWLQCIAIQEILAGHSRNLPDPPKD